jgi:hypothetical protein
MLSQVIFSKTSTTSEALVVPQRVETYPLCRISIENDPPYLEKSLGFCTAKIFLRNHGRVKKEFIEGSACKQKRAKKMERSFNLDGMRKICDTKPTNWRKRIRSYLN